MARWLLLLFTAVCVLCGPSVRCAMAGAPVGAPAPHRSCCDSDPAGHGVPALPCATMACCVLFAPTVPRVAVGAEVPCGAVAVVEVIAPETPSVRPPTPPPRIARGVDVFA